MKKVWIFCELENSQIIRTEVYGSLRALSTDEVIIINNKCRSENALRRFVGKQKKYIDSNYYIERKEVTRQTRKLR